MKYCSYCILKNKTPIEVSRDTWASWFETADRQVAETIIESTAIRISTVFLGIDHWFTGKDEPILFETMVFGGELDQEMQRYSTWEEAESGHAKMVERVLSFGANK